MSKSFFEKIQGFIPECPIAVTISDVEHVETGRSFNPYLYTIQLHHCGYSWTVHRRYNHFLKLHTALTLYRSKRTVMHPKESKQLWSVSIFRLKEPLKRVVFESRGFFLRTNPKKTRTSNLPRSRRPPPNARNLTTTTAILGPERRFPRL